ncbi:hypothetical protein B0T26DRAFT_703758 [Lasiosphaeria miniovina]|uniref:Uncharacterized protein n=1 Tax=Lasiosphaeria miniovina TaxID=1954250 RepID=A0AA40AVG2_9PEZI|nr:uncharacterized protein B0T26DRAFT_703758 [Lasiosphaeria miniovina]KAK0722727.1 hypothetical protein B0T26DRAFT_703758 [Lasiosphaeria miniovina]
MTTPAAGFVPGQAGQRYAPVPPTSTQTWGDSPPPPQPGAVPRLPAATATATAPIPPPPRAGEAFPQPPEPTAAARLPGEASTSSSPYPPYPPPPQMGIPAPTAPYAQRGTATATGPVRTSPPAYLPEPPATGPREVSRFTHPPGYQQDVNASELSGYQHQQRTAGQGQSGGGDDDNNASVWSSAMKWAGAAGQKLSAVESEVWRKINKE